MRDDHLWWLKPFTGSIVAILGLLGLGLALYLGLSSAQLTVKVSVGDTPLRAYLPFPRDRAPDLDISRGAPGYVASLGLAGQQLHYWDKDAGRTWIAVEAWMDGEPQRFAVAGYDGPPSLGVSPDSVRPVDSLLFATLVLRVRDATNVWCVDETQLSAGGPNDVEAGELNLLVLPGKVTLWTADGPHHEIEVKPQETVWCTLAGDGLRIDRRR